ncbi:MAG: hypothetical protein NTZ56_20560 [Acidobacteria bacterium]|nr:hypothetical protein [Acidobacteriota bacterium]
MGTLALALTLAMEATEVRSRANSLVETLEAKFQSFVLNASACGTVADGNSDDTQALQRCIDTLPEYATLDGEGRTYLVSVLNLKSRMRLRNFRLSKYAGTENMTSPVTLDGRTQPKAEVIVENVQVAGNRQFETNIVTPSAEDGGRHCFRFAGQLNTVALLNVNGSFCGTDGLQLGGQHATTSDAPEALALQNIVVRDAVFNSNRRVGIAFEGGHNLYFINVETRFNGRKLDPAASPTQGNYCAHVDNACFGTGVWTENDHDAAGGSFDGVYFVNLNSTANFTRAFYAYSQSGPKVTGFRAKSNLVILESTLDAGAEPVAGNPIAIQFSSSSPDGAGAVYTGVEIARSTINGTVTARGLDGLVLRDSKVTAPLLGFVEYFDRFEVQNVERRGDFLSSRWLRPDGTPGAVVRY